MSLVDKVHLLRRLICPKAQSPSSAFHYDIRMQTAENTGLVVFGWVEVRDDHIIGIREGNMAGRATGSLTFTLTGELATIGAVNAEDVARGMVSVRKVWKVCEASRPTCKL